MVEFRPEVMLVGEVFGQVVQMVVGKLRDAATGAAYEVMVWGGVGYLIERLSLDFGTDDKVQLFQKTDGTIDGSEINGRRGGGDAFVDLFDGCVTAQ